MPKAKIVHDERMRLRSIVYHSGKAVHEIAEVIGVTPRTLFRWMAGDTKVPKYAMIAIDHCVAEGRV